MKTVPDIKKIAAKLFFGSIPCQKVEGVFFLFSACTLIITHMLIDLEIASVLKGLLSFVARWTCNRVDVQSVLLVFMAVQWWHKTVPHKS